MPSDDVILNLKQIAGYPPAGGAAPSDLVLLQRGGLGGPYVQAEADVFVSSALLDGTQALYVGVPSSGNAAGGQVFTDGLSVAVGGFMMWNAYATQAQTDVVMQSGLAGRLQYLPVYGWQFLSGASSGMTEVPWAQQFAISPSGYVTVADQLLLGRDPMLVMEAATMGWVQQTISQSLAVLNSLYSTATVWSLNGRTGNVILGVNDIMAAGGVAAWNGVLQGAPTATTPPPASNDNSIATTAWVTQHIGGSAVQTFNGRSGNVTLQASDIAGAGGLANPSAALTGVPTAPTAAAMTNNTQIATTQYVDSAVSNKDLSAYAPINSPNFTGAPTAPTAPAAASDGRLATTAFVHNAVVAATTGVSSFNTRTGAVVLTSADITSAGGAVLASPIFTGVPQAPTATAGTNTQQIATTAFVTAALAGGSVVSSFNSRTGAVVMTSADVSAAGGALLASPNLTGTPTAPTQTAGNSSTAIATTAFVANAIAAIGTVVSSFNGRSGAVSLQSNDISAAGGAILASPAFSGVPTAPTASPGTNTAQIATTSFVTAAIAGGVGVSSFNSRTGSVTLLSGDISGAGGALLSSPVFIGVPAAPTAALATNTTQIATTAFVQAAIGAGSVTSFNTRTGAVTLSGADITGAGGALLASPTFSGTPSGPTAATNTNTTQLATTAFVQNAINAIGAGVVSFNGRTGAVSLIQNDVSSAGGALLASPNFSGVPTAPTPATSDSSTTIATTAYVKSVLPGPATVAPLMSGAAAVGTSLLYARQDHVHPSDTAKLSLSGGTMTGALAGTTHTLSGDLTAVNVTGSGAVTSTAGTVVSKQSTGNPGFTVQNSAGTSEGSLVWNASNGQLNLNNATGGGIAGLTVTPSFNVNCTPYSPAGGAWSASSDARIKTVEGGYEVGLGELLKLRPVRFRYKGNDTLSADDAESPHALVAKERTLFAGLIAQEAEDAFPGLVTQREGWIDGKKVTDFRDMNTTPIMYALINAVKTLAARLEALEARLA